MLNPPDNRQQVIAITQIVTFFVSGFCILKWIYRANYNAHQLTSQAMRYSSAWSIGWYFIPIANLWKPYGAMKEIWQVSDNPESWSASKPVPLLLSSWWYFGLFTIFSEGLFFGRLEMLKKLNSSLLSVL